MERQAFDYEYYKEHCLDKYPPLVVQVKPGVIFRFHVNDTKAAGEEFVRQCLHGLHTDEEAMRFFDTCTRLMGEMSYSIDPLAGRRV